MEATEKLPDKRVLKWEGDASHVYTALQQLKRTGWVERGVQNPESVKEHIEALISLAEILSPQLTAEETDGLLDMLEVHDWPEAIHGDEVILERSPGDQQERIELKFANEKHALERICKDLPNGETVMALWLRFETSDDPAAVFARQLDKYQAIEKALEYEETQDIPLFEEFLTYSIDFIYHPLLLERIEGLKQRWEALPKGVV